MMKTGFNKEKWEALLPEVYKWIDKVDLSTPAKLVSGAVHVVVAQDGDEASQDLRLNALGIDGPVLDKVVAALKNLGWKAGAAPLPVSVDGSVFLAVSPSKVKTTKEQRARAIGLDAAKAIKNITCSHLVIVKPQDFCTIEIFYGVALGLYQANGFKGNIKKDKDDDSSKLPAKVGILGTTISADEWKTARATVRAWTLTRFLQDAPANWLDPVRFGKIAEEVAKAQGITCKILDREGIAARGMGSFLSVNDGSVIEPRLITLEIEGKDNSRCVSLVGKGLTFDAGGISLKPSAGMEEMKYDMSGGAAVLGAACLLKDLKPPVKVICVIGATENLPSGSATKPGDVVVAMNGKTIEVQNTDAEGRLVLADLLHYVITDYQPEMIVDIATLTGAVLVALGTVGAGLLSNDDQAAHHLLNASKRVGEPMWQLPMWPELEAEVKGSVSDLCNIAKPNVKAGTIMGAMFLKEFVGKTKWVHLDVAGTAWNCKAVGYPTSGGCGFGMRTMVEACLKFE